MRHGEHHQATLRYRLCVAHKVLATRLWIRFDDYAAAEQYKKQFGSLAQGGVPASLLEKESSKGEI